MPISPSKPIALTLALAAFAVSAAPAAATSPPQSDAAMRKAIRDYAKHGPTGNVMQAHNLKVDCVQAVKVGTTRPCSGTFSLTRGGKIAHYRLTEKASTFRNSPGSIEYRLYAKATKTAAGLPTSIASFRGFLQ
jgi:hypothetical protein